MPVLIPAREAGRSCGIPRVRFLAVALAVTHLICVWRWNEVLEYFPAALYEEAKSKRWIVISVKNDWKRILN
jgi:hypothetical protein